MHRSPRAIAIGGLVMVLLQQLLEWVPPALPASLWATIAPAYVFFYPPGPHVPYASALFHMSPLYRLIPWVGVMAVGYGFGQLLLRPTPARTRVCLQIGGACIALFLVLGTIKAIGEGSGAPPAPFWMRMLDEKKYPPSQNFLLMTLGPAIAILPFAQRARGVAGKLSHHIRGARYPALLDRLSAVAYHWRATSENVGSGYPDAESLMHAWKNSHGHHANIMSPRFTEAGAGVATDSQGVRYWVLVFGTPR